MDLTNEQWAVIRPLIPRPTNHCQGRPPADPCAALNGILLKLRLGVSWYDLPTHAAGRYLSWQTCYRRYRLWKSSGLMEEIYRLLYQDLRDRAGIDLFQAFDDGTITLNRGDSRWHLHLLPDFQGT
jgi:transposase